MLLQKERVGDSISCKGNQAGTAHCKMCGVDIRYGGRGFLAIRDHIHTRKHQTRATKNRNTQLPGNCLRVACTQRRQYTLSQLLLKILYIDQMWGGV